MQLVFIVLPCVVIGVFILVLVFYTYSLEHSTRNVETADFGFRHEDAGVERPYVGRRVVTLATRVYATVNRGSKKVVEKIKRLLYPKLYYRTDAVAMSTLTRSVANYGSTDVL